MTTTDTQTPAVDRFANLRRWNIAGGVLHAVQALLVLALANEFALPVTATFLEDAPGLAPPVLTELFEIRIAWGVALFRFLSAVAHFTLVTPGVYDWYIDGLKQDHNYARWVEYALSSSVMVVLIAMLPGISDIAALGAIFGVNACMILFGWLFEKYETPGDADWLSYWFGVFAGAVPWIVIGIYIWGPGAAGEPPAFVYGIFFSLFIFFNTFAVNQVLQYRKVGKWADYVYGEKVYIILSLTAKSALAWQVFGGTLAT